MADAFSGSAAVAYMYKTKGLRVLANDRLRYCHHAARGILIRKESLSSEKGLDGVLSAPVSELERMELEILVGEIRHLNESIKKLEGLLRDQGPKLPGWENLTSIKSIGYTGAQRSAPSRISPMRVSWPHTSASCLG